MRFRSRRRSGSLQGRSGLRAGRFAIAAAVGAVVLALLAITIVVNPPLLRRDADAPDPAGAGPAVASAGEAKLRERAAAVLADTGAVWSEVFRAMGGAYREPVLVLFSGAVDAGCGFAAAATGPFYCPADERLFIDLSFFAELEARLGAGGDLARAYVIAHQVGHHVQQLRGISRRVQELVRRVGGIEASQLALRLELQADCYAGLWARRAKTGGALAPGDIGPALDAVSATGSDLLRQSAGRAVPPDAFTHGSAGQRARWFRRGLEADSIEACDAFAEADV